MSFTRTLRAVGSAVAAGALLIGIAPTASADEIRDSQWALDAFSVEAVWKQSTGKGVTVAVIDNGVNGAHPDLKGSVLPGRNFSTGDQANQETKNNHGTEMASIIAGHGHGPGNSQGIKGLAPEAKILPIKHWDTDGTFISTDSFAEELRYAVDQGAEVVNMSFVGPELDDDEEQAIAYAVQHDVLLVAGSGNDGTAELNYPAAAPGVVAVGAVGQDLKVWDGSNYGSHLLLTAPGVDIKSAGATSRYGRGEGTSDATAYVSAAAALVRAKFPNLTAGQVVNRLTKTALMPKGEGNAPNDHYGYGIIRPLRALTEDIPAGPKNGPLKMPENVQSNHGAEGAAPNSPDTGNQAEGEAAVPNVVILGLLALGVIAVVAIIVIAVVVLKRKNRSNLPPPGGPGGYGAPGAPGFSPHANPYQQPSTPGSYPSTPPTQPPGQR